MRTHHGILLIVFLLGSLAACAPPPTVEPTSQNLHIQPAGTPETQPQEETVQAVWLVKLSDAVNASPLVSGGLIIVPTADGAVHAVRADSGEIAWVYSVEPKFWDASVNVDEDRVCGGVQGRQVICLDAKTGDPLWSTSLDLEVQSRVALSPGFVFAPTTRAGSGLETDFRGQTALVALDAASGQIVWQGPTENYILRRPVVNGNIVVTGGAYQPPDKPDGEVVTRIYAFNVEDGSPLWEYQSNDGLLRWLESNEEVIAFSAASETVYALNLKDGTLLWEFGPGYWMQFPAMQDGRIYFGSGDERFQTLDASTGDLAWQQSISLSSLNQIGRPFIQDDRIWFNAVTGEIYALDLATGEIVQHLVTGRSVRVGGAIYQDFYILGDADGNLSAYKIR